MTCNILRGLEGIMKKTVFFLVIMVISLWMAACSSDDKQGDAEGNSAAEESQDMKDYANGTPWQIIDLDGIVTENTPVDVKDNFAKASFEH